MHVGGDARWRAVHTVVCQAVHQFAHLDQPLGGIGHDAVCLGVVYVERI